MSKLVSATKDVTKVLVSRGFLANQIDILLPRLHPSLTTQPKLLGQVIDAWNNEMTSLTVKGETFDKPFITATASAPNSLDLGFKIDMNMILAEREPNLLNIRPDMIGVRKEKILNLGLVYNVGELWKLLYFAPAGFFLQDWTELTKKFFYVEHNILTWLYDKHERKALSCHPMVSNALVSEKSFDHIRARFLFAQRTGYKALVNNLKVELSGDLIGLRELILEDNESFIRKIAPNVTLEEYNCLVDLIKNSPERESDDDAKIYEQLAELENIRYEKKNKRRAIE